MKKIDLLPRLTQEKSKLWDEIIDTGLGKILLYDDIDDYIDDNFLFDREHNCLWISDLKEVMIFAHSLTLINDKELEDVLLKVVLGVQA